MSLQKEITIILLVVIGLFACLDNAIQRFVIYPGYQDIDKQRASENVKRFQAALDREVFHLNQLVLDWSARGDTYQFIQDENEGYKKTSLIESLFIDIEINSVHFVDSQGRVVWGKSLSTERDGSIVIDELPDDKFPADHLFLKHEDVYSSVSGFIATNHGPMLISARPIVTSDQGGDIKGTLIMGKFFDKKMMKALTEQAGIDLEFWTYRCDSPEEALFSFDKLNCQVVGRTLLSKNDNQAFLEASSGKIVVDISDESDHLHSYAVVNGIFGNHFLLLRADSFMDITKTGRRLLNGALLSIITGGLLIVIVLREAIKLSVLNPILTLTDYAIAIRSSESHDSHISDIIRSENEIGILAKEFDTMVSRLGEARQQLVEQSYYSGMAEMVSGVMHNIRNAMTPIIAHIELMKEELKELPLKDMEAAAREISSSDTSQERLEMLKEFQEESFQYLDGLTSDFRIRLDGMAERVATIENIISGQEKYANGGRTLDDIDLEELINEALAMLKISNTQTIDIDIDLSIGEVGQLKGPRNALMHIFTNLINNAAEAIAQAEREHGIIRISAETEESDGFKFVHVMVSDNGVGILQENLRKIFERGFTSKSIETSGIGLHWCANTIASIHGRLYAESKGIDKGATIHLHIPREPFNS